MGHGHHWRSIFSNLDTGLPLALSWVPRSIVTGKQNAPDGSTVTVLASPSQGLRTVFIVAQEPGARPYLHTAFPAVGAGSIHPVLINAVHPVNRGLEARIYASLGEAAVTFFDPCYCLHASRYRPGEMLHVDLSAIAYSLELVAPDATVKTAVGDAFLVNSAILVSTFADGAPPASAPCGDEDAFGPGYIHQDTFPMPDDYRFCARVTAVENSDLNGIPFWRFRAIVLRVDDARRDIEIDICATVQAMRDMSVPVPGDQLSGLLRLQGTLPQS